MAIDELREQIQATIGRAIRLESDGPDQIRVYTPFGFDDGDSFSIVLRQEPAGWVLGDEGSTFMHLTYDIDEKDLREGTRAKIIANTLAAFEIEDRAGELVLPVADMGFGDAVLEYVQALSRLSDLTYLTRERAKSAFQQDLRSLIVARVEPGARAVEWHDPDRDVRGHYPVDYRLEGRDRPLFVFALPSDDRVQVATITLHQFERWGVPHRSVGVFEDQEAINRKVLARFSDIAGKQFSTLTGNQDRIVEFLAAEAGVPLIPEPGEAAAKAS
jgi:hypothetical protein